MGPADPPLGVPLVLGTFLVRTRRHRPFYCGDLGSRIWPYLSRLGTKAMSDRLLEEPLALHCLVSQIMSGAQIFARIARDANDHAAALLLVFFLVDHKRDEDDSEENGAEK